MAKYAFIKMWWNDLSTFPPAARLSALVRMPAVVCFRLEVRFARPLATYSFGSRYAVRSARLPAFNVRFASQCEPCGRSLPLTARVETRPKQPTVADGFNAFTPRITLYTSLPSRRNGIVIILTVSIIIISQAFVNAFAGERAGGRRIVSNSAAGQGDRGAPRSFRAKVF